MGSNGADIAVIGLAVMGQNLVLNMADSGWSVSVYNRTPNKTEHFVHGVAAGTSIEGFYDLTSLVGSLARPRKVMMMIKAGDPVDAQIDALLPHLEPGDVIIDGGNSLFTDSQRRCEGSRRPRNPLHRQPGSAGVRRVPDTVPRSCRAETPLAWPIVEPISSPRSRAAQPMMRNRWRRTGSGPVVPATS